jgi:hypothetical protein
MRRRSSGSRKPVKGRGKVEMPKRRHAPTVRRRSLSAPDQETEVVRLRRELSEAFEQQTATSEVLKVISSSVGDLKPVFETILAKAVGLCHAEFGVFWLREGDRFRSVALQGACRGE